MTRELKRDLVLWALVQRRWDTHLWVLQCDHVAATDVADSLRFSSIFVRQLGSLDELIYLTVLSHISTRLQYFLDRVAHRPASYSFI